MAPPKALLFAVTNPGYILALACALGASASSGFSAEETTGGVELYSQYRLTGRDALAAGGADVSQSASRIDLYTPLAGSSGFGLGLDLLWEHVDFGFDHFDRFLPGRAAPMSAGETVTLQTSLQFTPLYDWTYVTTVALAYSGQHQVSASDGLLFNGSIGAIRNFSDQLKIGLGLQIAQEFDQSAEVLPFAFIDWKISERWTLSALDGQSGRLSWSATEKLKLFAQLEFQWRNLRLRHSSSISDGSIRYDAFPLSFGVDCNPNKHLHFLLSAGSALAQSYRFRDRDGILLRTSKTRSPWIGTLELDYLF